MVWESWDYELKKQNEGEQVTTNLSICFFFSSSVKGLISSDDSAKFAWPVLAAWACQQNSSLGVNALRT